MTRSVLRPPSNSGITPLDDDADLVRLTTVAGAGASVGLRKKGTGVRAWLVIGSTGQAQVVQAGKHAIMRRTGLPARDLRIMDPFLSYPSAVLGRERAIVINLEHIKAIITAHEVLLLNSRDPSVTPFVEQLQRRILLLHHTNTAQEEGDTDWKEALVNRDGLKVLPFEFVTLEACLKAACSCLDDEARTLEQEAQIALDKLTSKISSLNLERVRQIKSRLVAITGRVQKVRDELEHLLDDDEDMAEMYLTNKMFQHQKNSSISSINERDGTDDGVLQTDLDDRTPAEISLEADGGSINCEDEPQNIDDPQERLSGDITERGRDNHGNRTRTARSSIGKHLDVEELEMLLEAYFVQIDGTLNKLSTLRDFVDNTEDYINIMLDDKQNQLLQMGVTITTATLIITSFVILSGLMGMNVRVDLFNNGTMRQWLWTVGGGSTATVFLYVIAIAWYKQKGLI